MDVFHAFPQAVQTHWKIGSGARSTVEGRVFSEYGNLTSIATMGRGGGLFNSPNVDTTNSAILLYVKPESLPTTDVAELIGGYIVQSPTGLRFAIDDAAEGRNQETGVLEHIELALTPEATA